MNLFSPDILLLSTNNALFLTRRLIVLFSIKFDACMSCCSVFFENNATVWSRRRICSVFRQKKIPFLIPTSHCSAFHNNQNICSVSHKNNVRFSPDVVLFCFLWKINICSVPTSCCSVFREK